MLSIQDAQSFLKAFDISTAFPAEAVPIIGALKRGFDVQNSTWSVERLELQNQVKFLEDKFSKQSSEMLQISTKLKLQESQLRTLKRRKQAEEDLGDPTGANHKTQLAQLTEANQSQLQHIRNLEASNREQKEQIVNIQEERNQIHQKFLSATQSLADLKTSNSLCQQSYDDLQAEAKQMQITIAKITSQKHELELHLKNAKEQYASVDNVRSQLNQNERLLVDQIQDLRLKNELLTTEIDDLKMQKSTVEELHGKLGNTRDQLDRQLREERERVRELHRATEEANGIMLKLRHEQVQSNQEKEIQQNEVAGTYTFGSSGYIWLHR